MEAWKEPAPDLDDPKFGQWYDIDSKPITFRQWIKVQQVAAAEGYHYRHVAWDEVGDYYVSTVLLGTDMSLGHEKRPLIFETLPFVNEYEEREITLPAIPGSEYFKEEQTRRHVIHPPLDQFMLRTSTKAQALRAHVHVCEQIRTMIRETLQVTEVSTVERNGEDG